MNPYTSGDKNPLKEIVDPAPGSDSAPGSVHLLRMFDQHFLTWYAGEKLAEDDSITLDTISLSSDHIYWGPCMVRPKEHR